METPATHSVAVQPVLGNRHAKRPSQFGAAVFALSEMQTADTITITSEHFRKATGRDPINDQLERVNCEKAGKFGHSMCGWCQQHDVPITWCGGAWDGHDTLDPKFIEQMREDNTPTKGNQ